MESKGLKPEAFDAHLANKTLRLAFVGMSNAGKSYRSRVLKDEAGFLWYEVDRAIEQELGFASIETISKWLGYPSDKEYAERERQYLALEDRFTQQASNLKEGKNLVFDTTGSIVHIDPKSIQTVRDNCLVVHLDVGESTLSTMIEDFFNEPKPVVWGEFYRQRGGESAESTIRRCFSELLAWRLEKYRDLAHVNIPVAELRDTPAEETLSIIKSHL